MTRNRDTCGTYGDNLRSDEGEGSYRGDAPPPNKPAGDSGNIMVLNERAGIYPVTETDPEINVRIPGTTSRVGSSCLSWFGPPPRSRTIPRIMRPTMVKTLMELVMQCDYRHKLVSRRKYFKLCIHARKDELGLPVSTYQGFVSTRGGSRQTQTAVPAPSMLITTTTTMHTVIQTAGLVVSSQYPMRIAAALRSNRSK